MDKERILTYFVEQAKDLYQHRLSKVILFGSYANNTATETSDIDLLVVLNDDTIRFSKESKALSEIVTEIAVKMDAWISPKPTTHLKYSQSDLSFFKNVRTEGITIYS